MNYGNNGSFNNFNNYNPNENINNNPYNNFNQPMNNQPETLSPMPPMENNYNQPNPPMENGYLNPPLPVENNFNQPMNNQPEPMFNTQPMPAMNEMPQPTAQPIPQPISPAPMPPQQPMMQEQPMNKPNFSDGNLYDFSNDLKGYGSFNNPPSFNAPKKKKNPIKLIFRLIEFLLLVFLILYIANDKGYINLPFLDNLIPDKKQTTNTNTEEKKEEEKKNEDEETIVNSQELLKEYTVKTYYLANVGLDLSNLVSPIYYKDTKITDLTAEQKLQSIIMGNYTVENTYQALKDDTEFKEVFPDAQAEMKDFIRYVDASVIESKYKSLYGEDLKNTNITNMCPVVVYSEKYKRYYLSPNCEQKKVEISINQFVYKVTTKGDNYYTYVSIVTYKDNPDGTIGVYRDAKATNKYKDMTSDELSKFELNMTTYKEFDKYKVTFEKKGDSYVFSSMEKVTESSTEA